MRKLIHAALTLTFGAALLHATAFVGHANTSASLSHKVTHNHEQQAARLRPHSSYGKRVLASHNHAAAPTFVGGCMEDCMRGLIPDELLVACAVLCGGGVVPGCAACLGWYTGVAIGCAIDCHLLIVENRTQKQRQGAPTSNRNSRVKKAVAATI